MLFAHLKRILKLDRLRLRVPCGARDEFHLGATAQTSTHSPSSICCGLGEKSGQSHFG